MKRNFVSIVLILIGLAVLAYPKAGELYAAHQQQKLLSEWQEGLVIIDIGEDEVIDDSRPVVDDSDTTSTEQAKKQEQEKLRTEYIQKHLEGVLSIEKIKLKLPILKGATRGNLNISVASMKNTGKAGELGNYALAAHRSHRYGELFNRLEELDVGDRIEVDTGGNIFKYQVVKKLYVKPEETWVLKSKKGSKEISLITCHPMIKPIQRLIIKGELIE